MPHPPHPNRYLRTSLLLVRYRGGYVLIHPGSSVVLATDALGARTLRWLIRGHSERDVRVWAETQRQGAGERVEQLLDRLDTIGALTSEAPPHSLRWRLRSTLSLLAGHVLVLTSVVVPLLPVGLLRLLFDAIPFSPLVVRNVGQIRPYVDANLRASGYENTSERWRREIARSSAVASARSFLFMYLALVLSQPKLQQLMRATFDMESFGDLGRALRDAEGGVVAGLHTSLYVGVIPLLGASGWESALVADMTALGVNVASDALPGLDLYGQYAKIFDSHSRMAGKALLERLRARQPAILAFDVPPQGSTEAAAMRSIRLLGRLIYRFDGPAWLAVRSGKPIVFVATYQRGRKTAVYAQPLYANPNAPRHAQVEDLTARLYATAETFLRRRPEAWMAWCYLHNLVVPDECVGGLGEIENGMALALP